MSYSKDLRERAVKCYKSGHTLKETGEVFGAGINTISQWVKKIDPEKLILFLEENPDAFLKETAEDLNAVQKQ